MRLDYNYINKATRMALSTTPAGDEFIDANYDEYLEEKKHISRMELLLFIQDEYVLLPDDDCSLWQMLGALNEQYCKDYESATEFKIEDLLWGFTENLICLRKCIWDDSSLRCFLSSLLDHLTEDIEEYCRNAPSCQFSLSASANGLLWVQFNHSGPFFEPWKVS